MQIDKQLADMFEKHTLLPAIIQQHDTKEVLMLAYMDREALKRTLDSGQTWFYSRSRQSYWHKGETSGNIQTVRGVYTDCDCDTILVLVDQTGNACHTGAHNCFFNKLL